MKKNSPSLLVYAASFLELEYLSDLRYLTSKQRRNLSSYIEGLDALQFTLFQWNDALEYLGAGSAEQTIEAARSKLLLGLSN